MKLSSVLGSVLISFTMMSSTFAEIAPKQSMTKEQVDKLIQSGHDSAREFWKRYVEIRTIQETTYGDKAKEGALMGAFGPAGLAFEFGWNHAPGGGPNGGLVLAPLTGFIAFVLASPTILLSPVTAPIGALVCTIEHGVQRCTVDSKIDCAKEGSCALRHSLESVDLNSVDDATLNALTEKVYGMGSHYKRRIEKQTDYKHIYPETYFPSFADHKGTAVYDFVKAVLEECFRYKVSPEYFHSLCDKLGLKTDHEKLSILGTMYFLLNAMSCQSKYIKDVEAYLNFAFLQNAMS